VNNFPLRGFHASAASAMYGAASGVDGHSIARGEDARAVTIGDSGTSFRSQKRLHQERWPIARARGGFKNFCRHADPLTPDVQQEARVSHETASMFWAYPLNSSVQIQFLYIRQVSGLKLR
jgi:hypothetical protein